MNDYRQPEFYRFNEDSLKLVSFVCGRVQKVDSILDLGAGCGVIGLEIANKISPRELTLLELQNEFIPYLESNTQTQLKAKTNCRIIHSSFGEWIPDKKYDLIVCNPPYFLPGHGQKSQDTRKHLARTFEKDNWEKLLHIVKEARAEQGRVYFVIRSDENLLKYLRSFSFLETVSDHLTFLELP